VLMESLRDNKLQGEKAKRKWPGVFVYDECSTLCLTDLRRAITCKDLPPVRVIALGDIGFQCKPHTRDTEVYTPEKALALLPMQVPHDGIVPYRYRDDARLVKLAAEVRAMIDAGRPPHVAVARLQTAGVAYITREGMLECIDLEKDVIVGGKNDIRREIDAMFKRERLPDAPKRYAMTGSVCDKVGNAWFKHDVVPESQLQHLTKSQYAEQYCSTIYVTQGCDYEGTVFIMKSGLFDIQTVYTAITRVHRLDQLRLVD